MKLMKGRKGKEKILNCDYIASEKNFHSLTALLSTENEMKPRNWKYLHLSTF